ncbi:MAG: hypothetical protein WCJ86_01865 [Candidatus Saccharibacteria bacterium]
MNKTITESDPAGNIKRPFKPESSIVVDINSAPSLRKVAPSAKPYDWSSEVMPLDHEQTDLTPPHGIPRVSIDQEKKLPLLERPLPGKAGAFMLKAFDIMTGASKESPKNLTTKNVVDMREAAAKIKEVRRITQDDRFNRHP